MYTLKTPHLSCLYDHLKHIAHLHGVRSVAIVKDHRLLNLVVVSFQFIEANSESRNFFVDGMQSDQLVFELSLLDCGRCNCVQVALYPLTNDVRLLCKCPAQALVVLLAQKFVVQCLVTIRHQLFHLVPPVGKILQQTTLPSSPSPSLLLLLVIIIWDRWARHRCYVCALMKFLKEAISNTILLYWMHALNLLNMHYKIQMHLQLSIVITENVYIVYISGALICNDQLLPFKIITC